MKLFIWKNGQVRLAVFVGFILSAAFTLFMMEKKPATKADTIQISIIYIKQTLEWKRAFLRKDPAMAIDTLPVRKELDSLYRELEKLK